MHDEEQRVMPKVTEFKTSQTVRDCSYRYTQRLHAAGVCIRCKKRDRMATLLCLKCTEIRRRQYHERKQCVTSSKGE